ncbi:hypothetical protein CXG81DRAFT_25506 [Caulochytrium protostelioides]|uniref:Metallo-dependent hydrolase n=1 Tax=Caulochytrium protostelioides TaxID=1555241 RepID=A0A4P9X947_9FUNG|nr:hypothetical protein CXG81DRAFT_25506 [Caulochytrium protostelioides]|eukprot:RKP01802.1 hypothetical protein CXG81DRAFT_25506 [Caulochytrium protostelioides]
MTDPVRTKRKAVPSPTGLEADPPRHDRDQADRTSNADANANDDAGADADATADVYAKKVEDADVDWNDVIDTHCHITDTLDPSEFETMAEHLRTRQLWMMASHAGDWDALTRAAQHAPAKCIPFYGIHPWHLPALQDPAAPAAGAVSEAVWCDLEDRVRRYAAAGIGEIGVDFKATDPATGALRDRGMQEAVWARQLRLAVRLGRPVSMHCVAASGVLVDVLTALDAEAGPPLPSRRQRRRQQQQQRGPVPGPPIILHSFGGSPETLKRILQLDHVGPRVYVGFSQAINGARTPAATLRQRIAAVPDDRLLLESDVPQWHAVDAAMLAIGRCVAAHRGWDLASCFRICAQNARRVLAS